MSTVDKRLALTSFCCTALLLLLGISWSVQQILAGDEFPELKQAVRSIESFKTAHGHLPVTLHEAGNDRCLIYERAGAGYKIMFATSAGDPMIYDSKTKESRPGVVQQ